MGDNPQLYGCKCGKAFTSSAKPTYEKVAKHIMNSTEHPEIDTYPGAISRIQDDEPRLVRGTKYGPNPIETPETGGIGDSESDDRSNPEEGDISTETPTPQTGENPLLAVPMPDGGQIECPDCEEVGTPVDLGLSATGELYDDGTMKGTKTVQTDGSERMCKACDILYWDGGRLE